MNNGPSFHRKCKNQCWSFVRVQIENRSKKASKPLRLGEDKAYKVTEEEIRGDQEQSLADLRKAREGV